MDTTERSSLLGTGSLAIDAIILSLGLFLIYRVYIAAYRLWFHPLAKVPGPKLGAVTNLPYQLGANVLGNWYHTAADLQAKYGPMVRVAPDVVLLDGSIGWPQCFAHRPANKPDYPKYPGFLFRGSEAGLVSSPREDHRRQRKVLAPAFSEAALFEQEVLIVKHVDQLIKRLQEHADEKKPADMVTWFNFSSFDIVSDLSLGESFNSLEVSDCHPWILFIFEAFRVDAMRRFCQAFPVVVPIVALVVGPKVMKRAQKQVAFSVGKAKARMALGAEPKNGRRDFMTYMLAENGLKESEIFINCSSFTVAGSETTASCQSAFFFYMGIDPVRRKILTDEIRAAFKSELEINIKSVAHLEYLQAGIEESLRIFPPAPATPMRWCPGEEVEGVYLPKGTGVIVSMWATHRNPVHFTEPYSYRPERWLKTSHPLYDPKFANDNRSVVKAFSYGTRDCIGKGLAYAEMRLVMARILYKFDFELVPGQEDWAKNQTAFIAWVKPPLDVIFTPRKD